MLQSVAVNGFVGHRLICEACGKEVWCDVRIVGAKTDDIDTHDVASPKYLFEYTQESEIPQSAGFGYAYRRHYRRVEHVEASQIFLLVICQPLVFRELHKGSLNNNGRRSSLN